jgi:hypothetical protein
MVSASNFCTHVQIDPSGKRGYVVKEMHRLKAFLEQQLPQFSHKETLETHEDKCFQYLLFDWMKDTSLDATTRINAERSLRCYISHEILQTCNNLVSKFGGEYGFTLSELLRVVLDDVDLTNSIVVNPNQGSYSSLAQQILHTFDPKRDTSLSTWTGSMTRNHYGLNQVLLEHGLIRRSDWSILNSREADEVSEIFTNYYGFSASKTEHVRVLVSAYHEVYRDQRRCEGSRQRCTRPTREQIAEICDLAGLSLPPDQVIERLKEIASYLRKYDAENVSGAVPTESIDDPDKGIQLPEKPSETEGIKQLLDIVVYLQKCFATKSANTSSNEITGDISDEHTSEEIADELEDEQSVFLRNYYRQVAFHLDGSIEEAIQHRHRHFQRNNSVKARKYLLALKLYCCDQIKMVTVAERVELKQFQVTRLIELDGLLCRIRQYLLRRLKSSVTQLVEEYCDPVRLEKRDQLIEAVLTEQIDELLAKPRINAKSVTLSQEVFLDRLRYVIHQLQPS